MADDIFTVNYLRANEEQTKAISIIVCIDGLPQCFSSQAIYSIVRYGDPNITYGEAGLVYGSLRKNDDFRDYLSLAGSSLTLSQRLEPEQGRGSISTVSFSFIDKDAYLTQVLSPGILLDDILGKVATVQLGYQQLSYPQDYFQIYRGYITSVSVKAGLVTLQISDPSLKKRQNIFSNAKTELSSPIGTSDTDIFVNSTDNFYVPILGPDGNYDPAITPYIQINSEYIQIPNTGTLTNQFTGVTRGTRGTAPAAASAGDSVAPWLQIQDHAIDMALKLMLSGWNGPWTSGVAIKSLAQTTTILGIIPSTLTLPDNVDAKKNYGLVAGDYITVSGSSFPGNNQTVRIVEILSPDSSSVNQVIRTSGTFTPEYPTSAVVAFRSKYDTYPTNCGLMLTPQDVDVEGHETLKSTFLSDSENSLRFFTGDMQSGKTFIESEIMLPLACYSVTRRGKLSANITKPPIATGSLLFLNENNILEPANILLERATNTRKFFNEILIQYDADDSGQNFLSTFDLLDSDSLNIIGLSSVLPITSLGVRSDLSTNISTLLTKRAQFLLSRYKRGALQITLKVNWGTGNLIEAGDVVALDGTNLFISNFNDGTREFGTQLLEVIDRTLDIRSGNIQLKLINGVGASATDRFASVSPSTVLASGSSTTVLMLEDSFSFDNPKFLGNEPSKWEPYLNQPILIHSEDYSVTGASVIRSFDSVDPYKMTVDVLPFAPPSGYVIDIPEYPTTTDINTDSTYKNIFGHINPTVTVATGVSTTQFYVDPSDEDKFFDQCVVRVHTSGFDFDSGDELVLSVSGNLITLTTPMNFAPTGSSPYYVDLIGYADRQGAYRWI